MPCIAATVGTRRGASAFDAKDDSGALDAGASLRGSGKRIGYTLTLDEWLDARRAGATLQPEALHLGLGAADAQTGNAALCPRSCPHNLGITACPVSAVTLFANERRQQAVYVADPRRQLASRA